MLTRREVLASAVGQVFVNRTPYPWVPTPMEEVGRIFDALQAHAGESHLELGAGDGRLVREAMRRGLRSLGIEIVPERVTAARQLGGDIMQGDMWQTSLAPYDVITTGNVDDTDRPGLIRKFYREARLNARLALGFAGSLDYGLQVFVQTEFTARYGVK